MTMAEYQHPIRLNELEEKEFLNLVAVLGIGAKDVFRKGMQVLRAEAEDKK